MAACLACTCTADARAARATSAIVSNPVRGPTEDSFEQWIVVKKTRFDGRSDPVFFTRVSRFRRCTKARGSIVRVKYCALGR
jgi:hypothetical protein